MKMVHRAGIEPATPRASIECSTSELPVRDCFFRPPRRRDFNPTEVGGDISGAGAAHARQPGIGAGRLVWMAGFEPAASAVRERHSNQAELHPVVLVGVAGLEPATSRIPSEHATRLRHTPLIRLAYFEAARYFGTFVHGLGG